MVVRTTLAALAALCSLAAGASRNHVASTSAISGVSRAAQGMKWTATLKPGAGSKVAGAATFGPGSAAGTSVATISITGGTPNASYPWHVHSGKCGAAGGPVGAGSAYKPVMIGADGTGKATATVNVATPSSGDYHVNVHASATDMGTIAACGDLAMAGM